jgi:hypothetical protein
MPDTFFVTMEVEVMCGGSLLSKEWRNVELSVVEWPVIAQEEKDVEGICVRYSASRGRWLVKFWRAASNGGNSGQVVDSLERAATVVREFGTKWNSLADTLLSSVRLRPDSCA